MRDTYKTKVIFRKFKTNNGEVIALFPELPGTNDICTCLSYMHTGQHSAASVDLSSVTVKATEAEYMPLKKELETIGYNLEVINRFSTLHFDARIRAINSVKEVRK